MSAISSAPAECDVVVIGAGIIGLAVASYLQAEGRTVLIIDRAGIAKETSSGNAGAFAFSDILPLASPGIMRKAPGWLLDPLGPLSIPPGYLLHIAPWLYRFWRASRAERVRHSTVAQGRLMRLAAAEMAVLVERAGVTGMVRQDGSLELYESETEFLASLPGWRARKDAGIAFEHVERARLDDLQPGLAPEFRRATFVPGWQTVSDPYDFAIGLARHVLGSGAEFQLGEARAVRHAGERVEIRIGEAQCIRARQAVIACGAWSRPLAQALGDAVPLETERGYNTTLPADAFPLKRQLIFGGHGFVITPLASGIRVGGAVELGGLRRPPDFRRSRVMLHKAARFLPGLRLEDGRQWMGFRPSLPDTLPVIGRSRRAANVLYAFGHGHLGLTQAAATGRLIADLAAGRPPAIAVDPFSPQRF